MSEPIEQSGKVSGETWTKEPLAIRVGRNGEYHVDSEDGFLGFADFWGKDEIARGNAQLFVAAPDLYAALQSVIEFFPLTPDEGSTERFERIADTFRRETGYLRPGKDCRLHSDEEREAQWDKWHAARITAARAALAKARGGE